MGVVAAAIVLASHWTQPAHDASMNVGVGADTYSRSDRPSSNYCGSSRVVASAGGTTSYGVLRFDVPLPAGERLSQDRVGRDPAIRLNDHLGPLPGSENALGARLTCTGPRPMRSEAPGGSARTGRGR